MDLTTTKPKTAPLTKEQQRYAQMRLHQIYNEREKEIIARHTTNNKVPTVNDLMQGIRGGTIKPHKAYKGEEPLSRHTQIASLFELTIPDAKTLDHKAVEAERSKLYAERVEIEDKLILGSASEAYAAILAFAAKK